jgi:transposase InsO family protein
MTEYAQDQEVALRRFQVIAPLLDPLLDPAEFRSRQAEILFRHLQAPDGPSLSDRTLRRWVAAYRMHGFDGLLPQGRSDRGMARTLALGVIEAAAALKRELPQRSVRQIIETLEGEGAIKPGAVKRSTLSQHLHELGLMALSKKQPPRGSRRFRKEHRNCLWQADLKFGPYLPIPGERKKMQRTYLIAFIDDYSRLVTHAEFYLEQKSEQLEQCLKRAILKRGIPDKLYVDNGKIFVSHWLRLGCARLKIRHITTAIYSPQSKGKIEKFMGRCDEFIAEMSLAKPKTLDDLNHWFGIWLEEGYNHHPHSALEGKTPAEVFVSDSKQLRFAGMEELHDAFLWEEKRKVDKIGCVKYRGRSYDVGADVIGKTVLIRFDPQDDSELRIVLNGIEVRRAHEVRLNQPYAATDDPFADPPEDSPERPSRYLQILAKSEKERRRRTLGAINYRDLGVNDV